VAHCHGTTTLDHSGLTLAQIEQLLGQLQPPSPPVATATPGGEQNVTQQASAQSQNGGGTQSQVATQSNGTVQVAPAPTSGVAAPESAAPAAVNQTAQGVVQLQVGCIFYCSDTRQTQQAQQSTTTVQSVNSGGAGAANTVSQGVWQVQVGCVAWCYDAVETQSAGASDSTVVAVAPPPGAPAQTSDQPAPASGPGPGHAPGPPVPSGGRSRVSGGAALGAPGAKLGGGSPGAHRVTAVSVSVSALAQVGGGEALASVATSRTVQTEVTRRRHHGVRRRSAAAPAHPAMPLTAASAPDAVTASSTAVPTFELVAALALLLGLASAGLAVRRRHRVG
jgi:hypothetical protein